jgi:multiple sugar transport system substrate-binding protein
MDVTRREVLKKGLVGAAGLTVLPTVIAACSSSATPTPAPVATPAPTEAPTPAPVATPAPSQGLSGSVSLGSNYSDPVPKKAMQDMADAFTAKTTVKVTINTVDHGTFQNQITSYLGGKPEDVFTWFSGFRMRFFAAQGFAVPIDDVWQTLTANYSDAFKVGSTGDDGHQYFVPIYNYPWAVFYRKSLFADKGYTVPATLADFTALCQKMQTDKIIPIAFGDKDGWPAMGTFDILNLRMNGYQFHVDLMAGKQKWTDPKVLAVFNQWKALMPFHQSGAAGRTWQDAAQALVKKQAGMYLLGMFVSQQFKAVDDATLADLDFFPYPALGTSFDAEKALDAPIDGFMVAAKSAAGQAGPEQTNAKAFVGFLGTGAAQDIYVAADPSNVAAAKDANTTKYNALQQKAVQLIGAAQKITQFLDRDTRPDFAGPNGMQNFLLKFIGNPNQDLNALLTQIQAFWDGLPPQ